MGAGGPPQSGAGAGAGASKAEDDMAGFQPSRAHSHSSRSGDSGASAVTFKQASKPEEAVLAPIRWQTVMMWVQHSQDFAGDVRSKQVYGACRAGVETLWKAESTLPPTQRHGGVKLEMLFRWIWPHSSTLDIARMFSHLCRFELERVRVSTPPVIAEATRETHTRAFQKMDKRGCGFITPLDIAADEDNVDEKTVKEIIGEEDIYLPKWLELVCEDSYRGHEEAQQAILQDGRGVRLHRCDAADMKIWTLRNPPKSDKRIWCRIQALEREIRSEAAMALELQDRIHWLRGQLRRQKDSRSEGIVSIKGLLDQIKGRLDGMPATAVA